jgi:hypothetical protein
MLAGIQAGSLHACERIDQWRSNLKNPFLFLMKKGFCAFMEGQVRPRLFHGKL